MRLTIAVLTYNKWPQLLRDCLASINQAISGWPFTDKLIVDNGACPPVPPHEGWDVCRLERNVGNIQGQNMCFALARSPYVLFVSDDVRFLPGGIEQLTQKPFYGQTAPAILWPNMSVQAYGGRIGPGCVGINNLRKSDRVDYIPSITYLMSKSLWENVGGFDARLPGAYEDVDMGLTLGPNLLRVLSEVAAIHLGNSTLQYGLKDKWRFWQARKRIQHAHPCKP